jgi:hypothetical protein
MPPIPETLRSSRPDEHPETLVSMSPTAAATRNDVV